jgi:16S rRNA (guanine966-N2)-methyltransferase
MRVIAGSAGGVPLTVPRTGVRPTMDRVKGAIFSSLGETVIGARVLDLFAGSGALGIEALSRGAASGLFVEEDPQSAAAIEKNLWKTNLRGHVRRQDVFKFLRSSSTDEKFRLIFADPPYERTKSGAGFTEKILADETLPRLLEPGGVFVLEKRPGEKTPVTRFWSVDRAKRYGATEVLFLSAIRNQCQSGPPIGWTRPVANSDQSAIQ